MDVDVGAALKNRSPLGVGKHHAAGNRSIELAWDGTDEWGAKIGRGVYLYHLSVKTPTGKMASKWERLVILD